MKLGQHFLFLSYAGSTHQTKTRESLGESSSNCDLSTGGILPLKYTFIKEDSEGIHLLQCHAFGQPTPEQYDMSREKYVRRCFSCKLLLCFFFMIYDV